MAGIYAFFGSQQPERIASAARRLRFFDEPIQILEDPQFSAAWVGHDDPELFGPSFDAATGVRILSSGRVSWDEAEWQRAERMTNYEGGLSNRLLLDLYLRDGADALRRHNGPAALLVSDPRHATVHLFTDHFGYHPIFIYSPDDPGKTVISTFADAIADDPAVQASHDPVAVAEFLSAWRVTPPHTYYRGIEHPGAAMHLTWNLPRRTVSRHTYWQPYCDAPFPNIDVAAEELADAVSNAVRIRTLDRLSPVVSFTSGGMDSRAVLFSGSKPANVIGVNLYDVQNNESRISHRLCDAAGCRYVGVARDIDYYPRWLAEGVRLSGAMWSAEDNHFLGTREIVTGLHPRTVITACTTDWLFKGYGLEKRYARLAGRNLPIKVFTHDRVDGFLPNVPRTVPAPYRRQVAERLAAWFDGTPRHLQADSDWLLVEDRRVRPACYAVSVSGQIMYRAFPFDTFLADRRVADCYSKMKAAWKINADVWAKAVQRICKRGGDIEDANFGWPVGSPTAAKLAVFGVGWLKRRIKPAPALADGLATNGSWPNLGWYARNSNTLRQIWEAPCSETREIISSAWGSDPWSRSLEEWSATPDALFRLLTVATHIQQRKLAMQR